MTIIATIDGTSIGRVVSDMLWDQGVDHKSVQMTGGQDWSKKGARYVNADKTFMIENLAVRSPREISNSRRLAAAWADTATWAVR